MQAVGSLHITRALVGIAALVQSIAMAMILSGVLDPGMMRQPFFEWLPLPTRSLLPFYVGLWGLAAVAFALGWRVRLSGAALALLMGYSLIMDQQTYSNHGYLLVIVVLLLMLPDDIARRFLRLQMSSTYFFGSVSKLNLIYLSGAIMAGNFRHGWLLPFPDALLRWEVMIPLALGSIMLDFFLAFAFWLPRYRMVGLTIGLVFHLTIIFLFPANIVPDLIAFALVMFGLYCTFVDPVAVWRAVRERAYRLRDQPVWRLARGG